MADGEHIIALIEFIAALQGQRLTLSDGVRRYGKHSLSSTGAVFLSAMGIHMHKLGLLARWASAIITHYTRVAPLKSITDDFKRLHEHQTTATNGVAMIGTKMNNLLMQATKDKLNAPAVGLTAVEHNVKQQKHRGRLSCGT